MRDKISIIVPVYKVEKYLDKCVESIVNQTYKNLEIILVDDGSPDSCPTMCDEWAKKDSRIKVIHKENGGVSSARNLGIDKATGEYVCFVDSDDWVELDYAQNLLYRLKDDNTDCAICNLTFYGEKKTGYNRNDDAVIFFKNFESAQKRFFFSGLFSTPWNKIFKTKILKDNNIRFNEKIHFAEDTIFFYDYLTACDGISIISKPLYNYNIAVSVATKKFWPEMEQYMIAKMDSQKKFLNKLEADIQTKNWLISKFAWQSMGHVISDNYLYRLSKKEALEALKRTYDMYFEYIKDCADECIKDSKTRKYLLSADLENYYKHLKLQHLKNNIKTYPRNIAKKIYKKHKKKL